MIDIRLEKKSQAIEAKTSPEKIMALSDKALEKYIYEFNTYPPTRGYYVSEAYYLVAMLNAINTKKELVPSDLEVALTPNTEY